MAAVHNSMAVDAAVNMDLRIRRLGMDRARALDMVVRNSHQEAMVDARKQEVMVDTKNRVPMVAARNHHLEVTEVVKNPLATEVVRSHLEVMAVVRNHLPGFMEVARSHPEVSAQDKRAIVMRRATGLVDMVLPLLEAMAGVMTT